ncbi:MAG: hypothetical protein GWP06_04925, partial [Actinobacteria bacterium]|nr:hypothetical protein [Actinomycetota bacterium]
MSKILVMAVLLLSGTFVLSYSQSRKGQLELGVDFSALRLYGGVEKSSTISGKTGLRVNFFTTDFLSVGYNWNYGTVRPKKGDSY